jgi:hypothetical protein
MSTSELDGDDVVSMSLGPSNFIATKTFRVNEIDQRLKDKLNSSISNDWFKEGVECESLKASTGGGWQKGKIRIREICIHFEFVSDEPEPSPDSNALAPLSESVNPE